MHNITKQLSKGTGKHVSLIKYQRIKNTRFYNLISAPQITRLLLEDAIISSKTEPPNGSKNENRNYGEVRNNKAMLNLVINSNSLS